MMTKLKLRIFFTVEWLLWGALSLSSIMIVWLIILEMSPIPNTTLLASGGSGGGGGGSLPILVCNDLNNQNSNEMAGPIKLAVIFLLQWNWLNCQPAGDESSNCWLENPRGGEEPRPPPSRQFECFLLQTSWLPSRLGSAGHQSASLAHSQSVGSSCRAMVGYLWPPSPAERYVVRDM